MTVLYMILGILAVLWGFIGIYYYAVMREKISRRPQLFVLFLVGGPLVWVFFIGFLILNIPLKLIETTLERFEKWLTERN